ncbi:MAG TPA: NAD(+)/NADH kinase [Solirubrobacteraceae bacterium]|nr:NAD(+)/NADH kinase [Solirubrobacteraceae bacterium]
MQRIGLVVHPRRPIDGALSTVGTWAGANGVEVAQVRTPGQDREIAPEAAAADCDLVVALGGDGTTLAALRVASAADKPVLGVACGSLGALTATSADDVDDALERFRTGDWRPRRLPSLAIEGKSGHTAINDLVVVRHGAGQVAVSVFVDEQLFVRFSGDGVVVATPLGSSAYTLAAGGPILAPGSASLVVTPLAPHGGCCPPLVTGPDQTVRIVLEPGWGGARVELDGQIDDVVDPYETIELEARLREGDATLVALGGEEPMLAGLRRRKILMDSPRMLAREVRNPVDRV